MNIERLRRTAKAVVLNPLDFDMDDWVRFPSEDAPRLAARLEKTSCGCTGCFAGFASWLAVVDGVPVSGACVWTPEGDLVNVHGTSQVRRQAIEYLDLTEIEAIALFYRSHWPQDFSIAYASAVRAKDYKDAARVLQARVEYFIKTGK